MMGSLTWNEIGRELRPYPGREWMVVRIVLAVLIATVLVMAFRLPVGWLSLYFCFVLAKPTTKQTFFSCIAILMLAVIVIPLSLLLLKYVAEPDWLRLLALAAVLYGAFFMSHILSDGDVVRNLAVLLATILTFPDVYPHPAMWEQAAFWLFPVALAGMLPIMFVTLLIRPEHVLPPERVPPAPKYKLAADRWTNPQHQVYALKGTLAAMATYFIYTALNFQEIQTALMTCLILGLPTTGEIMHKTRLRITGATIGAMIALVGAIWLVPLSDSLWLLLAIIAFGSSVAAWVALSSSRLAYAGWQMALAQFMMITHSFGPSADLTILRDRLLGIMLGNLMMALTFKYLWPESGRDNAALQKVLPVILLGAVVLLVSGCRSTEDLAPRSASQPWRSSQAANYALPPQYAQGAVVSIDPDYAYSLSELADMAQRNNPLTRVAWEQARAAAASVGVTQSAYYPQLNLVAAAGYEHIPFPLPKVIFPQGYFYSDMMILRPELQLDWLLWDFGRRDAMERSAREQSMAQNFMFNVNHQQVLFTVCRAYYKLTSMRSALAVAEAALVEAKMIERASQTALENGLATRAEYLQAQQFVAQCAFDKSALEGEVRKAQIALAESVGLDPGQALRIRDIAEMPLPDNLESSVESLVDHALAHRPDIRARVAELRMAEAAVEEVEAQAGPVLVASGNAGPVYSSFSVEGTPWVSSFEAQYGGGVALTLPIFDGFRRQNLKIAAEAEKRRVEAEMAQARNTAVSEVWEAYIDFENARRQLRAAEALVAASEASQEATLASFEKGFSSVIDVQTQQVKLIQARESYNQARTAIFLSASLLQLATGQLSVENLQ